MFRTSLLLREQVRQSVPFNSAIDRHLRVVSRWKRPATRERQRNRGLLRRAVSILHSCRFAEHLLRGLLLGHGCLRGSLGRLQGHFLLGGNLLGGFMPEHLKTMWGVVEDVLSGPSVLVWSAALTEFAFQNGEFRVLTCDGTVKIALALNEQAQHLQDVGGQGSHNLETGRDGQPSVHGARDHQIRLGRCANQRQSCVHHGHFDSAGGDHSSAVC